MNNLISHIESWPEKDTPPFADIDIIGCCEEHEKWGEFKWYREHSWKDFKDLLVTNPDALGEVGIDENNFQDLHPKVWRYFSKGALSALAQVVSSASSYEDISYTLWRWVERTNDEAPRNEELSKEEIQDICSIVDMIEALPCEESSKKEIETTKTIWRKAL